MKVTFVTLPEPEPNGVVRYMANIAIGLRKIGVEFEFVTIEHKARATRKNYLEFGLSDDEVISINTDTEVIDYLNKADILVYSRSQGYYDYSYFKKNPSKMPWWYDVVDAVNTKAVAFIHDPSGIEKYAPWLEVFENKCQAFIANKTRLAEMYGETHGNVDCYVLPIPVACPRYSNGYYNKDMVIASTARIDGPKRQANLVTALQTVPEWHVEFNYGSSNYFTLKYLKQLAERSANVFFVKHEGPFSDEMMDEVYAYAALVYNSTKFAEGHGGGMECVTMEGAIRGAVPLLSEEWCAPWPGAPDVDACYKFSIKSKTESNIAEIIKGINPKSKEYKAKQVNIIEHVRAHHDDMMIAKRFMKMLRNI